jgi:hypothetical protein
VQYQTIEHGGDYKYNENEIYNYIKDKDNLEVLYKWFENSTYGINFKVRVYNKKTNEHELLELSFIDRWLVDKDIRLYEAMRIVPKNCPANIYNLWSPFAVDKMEDLNPECDYAEEIQFVLNHIKTICSGDEAIYNYFIKWIGQMLKYPETKSKVIVLFVSLVEGTGKGSVVRLLERIIGVNKVIATQQPETYVWGEFNSLMGNGYLVVLDELEKLQTAKSGMARLKGLITEPTFPLHGKGKDPVISASYHRFIGASNKILGALETTKVSTIWRCVTSCNDVRSILHQTALGYLA